MTIATSMGTCKKHDVCDSRYDTQKSQQSGRARESNRTLSQPTAIVLEISDRKSNVLSLRCGRFQGRHLFHAVQRSRLLNIQVNIEGLLRGFHQSILLPGHQTLLDNCSCLLDKSLHCYADFTRLLFQSKSLQGGPQPKTT